MSSPIATAWVEIAPEMRNFGRDLKAQLNGATAPLQQANQSLIGTLGKGLGGALVGAGIAVAGIAATVAGIAVKGGLDRALAIQAAEAKLTGLGHSAEAVERIMQSATDAVMGTIYSTDQAATVAASAVAAGIEPGQQLTDTLALVADAATIAGTDMESMGAIFNKVVAGNRLSMEEVNQLQEAGIPIMSQLAETLGVSAGEVRELVSSGQVGFAEFSAAMEDGLGGAAQSAGDTFVGALANVKTALSNLTDDFWLPILDSFAPVLNEVKGLINDLGVSFLGPNMDGWAAIVEDAADRATEAVSALRDLVNGEIAWSDLLPSLDDLAVLGPGGAGLAGLIDAFVGSWETLSDAVQDSGLLTAIEDLGRELGGSLADALIEITPELPALVEAATDLLAAVVPLVPSVVALATALLPVVPMLADLATDILPGVADGLNDLAPGLAELVDGLSTIAGTSTDALSAIFSGFDESSMDALLDSGADLLELFGFDIPDTIGGMDEAIEGWEHIFDHLGGAISDLLNGDAAGLQSFFDMVWTTLDYGFGIEVPPVIQDFATGLSDLLASIFGFVGAAGESFAVFQTVVSQVWGSIQDVTGAVWGSIQAIVAGAILIIQSIFTGNFAAIPEIVQSVWARITGLFGGAAASVRAIVSGLVGNVIGFFRSMMSGAAATVSGGVQAVLGFFRTLPARIIGALSGAGSWLVGVGRNIIQGLIGGIQSMVGSAVSAVVGAGQAIIDGARDILGIASPSKVFRNEIGRMVGLGMALGITDTEADVQAAMARLTDVEAASRAASLVGRGAFIGDARGAGMHIEQVFNVPEGLTAADVAEVSGQTLAFTLRGA